MNETITDQEKKHQIVNLYFDCYEFYKFIEAIEKYVDEIELVFENSEFTISFMDAARIMICKCTKQLDRLVTIEKMSFGVSTSDLKTLLRTRKVDKKEVELFFDNTKEYIEFVKTSEKFNTKIERTLNLLDLDLEHIPMDNLNAIEYPSKAKFPSKILDDFFYESSNYSEIVEIEINENDGISFSETGSIGNSKYIIKRENCNEIEGFGKGSYSYTFLTPIKPLLPILTDSDITLNIKNDHPIKLELYLESLDFDFLVFLAPRVEEEDFDYDYDENDEF